MATTRKDLRGRTLRKGEMQRSSDKRYAYSYTDPLGRRKYIYANDLVTLREKEAQLTKDQMDGLDIYVAGKATVNFVFDRYMSLKTNLRQLYQQAEALQISRADYAKVLEQQRNIELLNKALNAGQISVIDYFTELTTIYDSHQSYLDVEKEYHSILAQLYQYKL